MAAHHHAGPNYAGNALSNSPLLKMRQFYVFGRRQCIMILERQFTCHNDTIFIHSLPLWRRLSRDEWICRRSFTRWHHSRRSRRRSRRGLGISSPLSLLSLKGSFEIRNLFIFGLNSQLVRFKYVPTNELRLNVQTSWGHSVLNETSPVEDFTYDTNVR